MENKSHYLPYLDGLRGIAISIVVLSHAGLGHIIPGKFGVTLFFFISGFLISKLLLAEIKEKGQISFLPFYLRRFFRLYPALLVMIICSWLASLIMQCHLPAQDIFAALFYYTNYYIGWFRTPVEDCKRILDILWSLSVEEHFYFMFPLLVAVFLKKATPKPDTRFAYFLLFICVASIAIRIFTYYSFEDHQEAAGRIYFSTHTRMDSIVWGCLAAVLISKDNNARFVAILQNKWMQLSGILLLVLSVGIRNDFFRQSFLFSFQGIGLFLLVPAIGTYQKSIVKNLLSYRWLIFLGKISYSLYLFHWVFLKLSNYYFEEFSLAWQLFFWTGSLALSLGSFYLVEKPFIQIRKRFGSSIA